MKAQALTEVMAAFDVAFCEVVDAEALHWVELVAVGTDASGEGFVPLHDLLPHQAQTGKDVDGRTG